MSSEALESKLVLESAAEELHDGPAHDNLAPVRGGAQTGCMVDRDTGVVAVASLHLSGVNGDPYPKLRRAGPGSFMQAALQCGRRANRGRRSGEHNEVTIAFTAYSHDLSAELRHRALDCDIQNIQRRRHPLWIPHPVLRAALDVGQQQHQDLLGASAGNRNPCGVHASRL
jgi:hypothetical protein